MGVDRPLKMLLDLSEPVWDLCQHIRELVLPWIQRGIMPGFDYYGRLLNFDPYPVMDLVIRDLKRSPHEFCTVDEVAEYLKQQGVPADFAKWLSSEITRNTLDVIGSQFPNFTFHNLATDCLFELSSNATILSITFLSGMEFDRKNVSQPR